MSALDRFILPEDVVITPIVELPNGLREQLEHEDGDCAVTRPRSRGNSTVVDSRAAGLLERFRSPATIVDAVIDFSAAEGLDAGETLDGAFGLLSDFVADGLLLAADSELARPIVTSLQDGDRVGAFEIVEPVHVIIDTEVYLAVGEVGHAGIKIARPGSERSLAAAFRREAEVLEHLDGTVSPRLLDLGAHEGRPYLAVSWCAGVDALNAAAELRSLGGKGRAALLQLAQAVIASYAQLHAQGVAHGDVHPRNVLVTAEGSVRLIDFGLAGRPSAPGTPSTGERGGVDFFLEPESAAARLGGGPPPALSLAGEQYSVAALLYLLLTGAHTQEFSLEPEAMLRQLAQQSALPFAHHGITDMGAVEEALRPALAKDPAQRYRSMAELLGAFRTAVEDGRSTSPQPDRRPPDSAALLDEVLDRLAAPDGELYAGELTAPRASAMNGAAGFAYALLRIAGIRGDESLLALADLWAVRAHLGTDGTEAFWNPELEITPEVFGESSFYHHLGGVEGVLALVAAGRGDEWAARLALEGFLTATARPCEHVDIAFGKSGLLLGAALLLETLSPIVDSASLRAAGEALRDDLWQELERQPPLTAAPELGSLGAAHGWAGYLYAILCWGEAAGTDLPAGLAGRLHELGAVAIPAGRGLRWPYDASTPMPHVGLEASWCNGAAGYVFLWTAARRAFGEEAYDRWARMAGWTAYESRAPAVGDLCCGFAGRAYAMLCLHRYSGEEVWLERARLLTEQAAKGIRRDSLRRDSLFKGDVGVALLAAELERPLQARMPLFELDGVA